MWQWLTQNNVAEAFAAHAGPVVLRLLAGLVVLLVGRLFVSALRRAMVRLLERTRLEPSARVFLSDVLHALSVVALGIVALETAGIRTTALVTVLGAAGLAIGLAWQGALSNFAAGVMLVVLRPYKVGDHVIIGKYQGAVAGIKIFHTALITDDHREITIPNGGIINAPIENLSVLGRRRVDLELQVKGPCDLAQVKLMLEGVMADEPRILTSPSPTVVLAGIGEPGVTLLMQPWVAVADVALVRAELVERAHEVLAAHVESCTIKVLAA